MSRVNNSVVFIIGPDLPSVPPAFINSPWFCPPKLIGFSWCSLPPDVSQQHFPTISFGSFLIPTLSLLYKISCPNVFCVYFIIIYFFFKIGLMSRVPCGRGRSEQKCFLQYKLYISSQSQVLDCIQEERLHHRQSRCDEMCEVL